MYQFHYKFSIIINLIFIETLTHLDNMTTSRTTRAAARSGVKEATEKRSSKSIKHVRKWQQKMCTIEDTTLKVKKWVYAEMESQPKPEAKKQEEAKQN